DHGIGEVLLVIEAKGVGIGRFFGDGTKFGMIAAEASDGSRRARSFGCSEEAGGGQVHAFDASVAMDALIGVFDELAFVSGMFGVTAEAGLVLLHVHVVELAAFVTIRATLIHGGGSFGLWTQKIGEMERVRVRAGSRLGPVAQPIARFVVARAAV